MTVLAVSLDSGPHLADLTIPPLMHPEAIWTDKEVEEYAASQGHVFSDHFGLPGFPVPFRPFPRGRRGWFAGEVVHYFRHAKPLPPATEFILYRFYNEAGNLLYVGVSMSALTRFRGHKARAGWFRHAVSIKLERFETRAAMYAAEDAAIKAERPLCNKV